MSSNDQIVILKKDGMFEVHHNICVDNDFVPDKKSLIGKADSHEEAVELARKSWEDDPMMLPPEYGVVYWYPTKVVEDKGGR